MQKRSSQRSTATEHTADFRKEHKMEYTYGMRLRGFSIGCQPMNGFIERQDDKTGRYHDLLVYARELTDKEITDYDLDDLNKSPKYKPGDNVIVFGKECKVESAHIEGRDAIYEVSADGISVDVYEEDIERKSFWN